MLVSMAQLQISYELTGVGLARLGEIGEKRSFFLAGKLVQWLAVFEQRNRSQ